MKSGLGEACSQKRAVAFACLKENVSLADEYTIAGPCSSALDEFATCGSK